MTKLKTLLLSSALLATGANSMAEGYIHTIGDYTMANYDESATVTRGWCKYLQSILSGITATKQTF